MLYKLPADITKMENVQQFERKQDKCDTINFASLGQVLVSTEPFEELKGIISHTWFWVLFGKFQKRT